MINVVINNSLSEINGISIDQHKHLRKILSYLTDQKAAYYSSGGFRRRNYLIDKQGVFPTGLLYLVKKYLKDTKQIYRNVDLRIKPSPALGKKFSFRFNYIPYEEQLEAADACEKHSRGIVCAPTGVGKTVIIGLIISKIKVKTLVVVPTLDLKHQTTEDLRKMLPKAKVGPLSENPDIAVENVDALDTSKKTKYDCVIIDEFHHSAANTYRDLNKNCWDNVYYKFGMTATPFRSNDNERLLLESVLSRVIYRVGYHTAVEKGYIVPMEAYYVCLPITKTLGHTWPKVYKDLVVNNKERNEIIANMLLNLRDAKKSTLCLVKEIEHGKNIQLLTNIDFGSGEEGTAKELIKKFNSEQIQPLIGTTGVLGEGIDTKPAEYIIISGLGKSKNQFMQNVGRGFRKYKDKTSCKIVIFKDNSHKWTREHFKAQCKILLEEYGIEPVELTPVKE